MLDFTFEWRLMLHCTVSQSASSEHWKLDDSLLRLDSPYASQAWLRCPAAPCCEPPVLGGAWLKAKYMHVIDFPKNDRAPRGHYARLVTLNRQLKESWHRLKLLENLDSKSYRVQRYWLKTTGRSLLSGTPGMALYTTEATITGQFWIFVRGGLLYLHCFSMSLLILPFLSRQLHLLKGGGPRSPGKPILNFTCAIWCRWYSTAYVK